MSHPSTIVRISPAATLQLTQARAAYAHQADLFNDDFEGALRILEGWSRNPPNPALRNCPLTLSFLRLSCVLGFVIDDDGSPQVQSIRFSAPPAPGIFDGPAAGVPRRFGMGAMVAFTLAFAGMFGALKMFKAPIPLMVILALYFGVLGLGQSVLFGAKNPRRASILVGIFYCPAAFVTWAVWQGDVGPIYFVVGVIAMIFVVGPLTGYTLGGLLAGLFLKSTRAGSSEPVN